MAARRPRWLGPAALGAALLGALALPASAAKDDLDLVSRATGGEPAGAASDAPAISADGRVVAFASRADNLSDEDVDGTNDVFVRDMVAGTVTLVSRADGAAGAAGDLDSFEPSISADGRLVAFATDATNLSPADANGAADVYVRDVVAGTTTLAGRATGPDGERADLGAGAPQVSGDGRAVAFASAAANLSSDDLDGGVADVFVRDLQAATTALASRAGGAAGPAGDAASANPAISSDGRLVAFETDADNLVAGEVEAVPNVVVRDLAGRTTVLASRGDGPGGAGANGPSGGPSVAADGGAVAFLTSATNLPATGAAAVNRTVVRDLRTGRTVAVGPGGESGTIPFPEPSISSDGRRVLFGSTDEGLSPADAAAIDVFVRDTGTGETSLVSRAAGPAGAGAADRSSGGVISADGRVAAFWSDADNLSDVALTTVTNVFRRDLGPVPPLPAAAGATPAGARRSARCAGRRATIVGTARRDVIRGTARRDVIAALAGNDVVRALAGNDLVCLGAGADRALGGPGADRILGGPGADLLRGGPGADRLLGQAGADRALGGAGRDRCAVEARAAC